jgi:hypothetical protein
MELGLVDELVLRNLVQRLELWIRKPEQELVGRVKETLVV